MKKRTLAMAMATILAMTTTGCVQVTTGDQPATTTQAATQATQAAQKEEAVDPTTAEVTLQIVDWADSFKAQRESFHKDFMAKYPNITIEYTCMTFDQFQQSVITSIKSGDAPDLFPVPSGMQLSAVVNENWFQPMDPYFTDGFLDTFSDSAFGEGSTHIGGSMYAIPSGVNLINTMIFYNQNVLDKAGVTELPVTWSEFIATCKEITEAGDGEYYGLIDSGAQTNRLELFIRTMASTAGGKTSDINQMILVDGQNVLNSEAMVKAFDFYNQLIVDGSVHPDSITLKAPEARALFAQDKAAFIVQGDWCVNVWRSENPDLNFGVRGVPVPDEGATGKAPYIASVPWLGIASGCEHPEVAALYLEELYSAEAQEKFVEEGAFVSIVDGVNEKAMTDPVILEYFKLHQSAATLAPSAIAANAKAADVYTKITAISPSLGEILQGTLAQAVDYEEQLDILADATQKNWESAIEQVEGVSAEDFEFKNWDPMVNYTSDFYGAK